jgi:hypothetical protein
VQKLLSSSRTISACDNRRSLSAASGCHEGHEEREGHEENLLVLGVLSAAFARKVGTF